MKLDISPIKKQLFVEVPSVQEFSEFFMEHYAGPRNKPSELIAKRQILGGYILPMFGDFKLNEISNEHIDIFVSRLRDAGASPKTVNNRLAVLNKMLRYAYTRKLIDKVPAWQPLKVPPKQMRFLSVEECCLLLGAAQLQGPYWYAMVMLALHTGMRNGEIRALEWRDVDIRRGVIRVRQADYRGHTTTPKSMAGIRTIPINAALAPVLNAVKPLGPLVFGKPPKGDLISHETTRNRLRIMCKEAGIKPCGWHTLRHTYASHMAIAGTPMRTLQELLGHSTLQMTTRYAHLTPEAKSKAADALVNLFKPRNP